ncbi:DUF7825 domain-containing protein [Nonomuraea dietziae]
MNPWQEVVERIEAGDNKDLVELLRGFGEVGRRAVAVQLPAYLAGRVGQGWEARWEVRDRAAGFRLAGAACLGGVAQVAAWLNRRELRDVSAPETDAARILSLIEDRPVKWREELAVRLVRRLRPLTRRAWPRSGEGWELAAALVLETGVDVPDSDAFVAGWAWRLTERRQTGEAHDLAQDPLLDQMVPRLFHAQGVAEALAWENGRSTTVIDELAELAAAGRVSRRTLLEGCASRFMAGGEGGELAPFVTLWRRLGAEVAEIPVLDFVRLLPSAPALLVELMAEELRRADAAGAVDDELWAEAVQALTFRAEKKHVTAGLRWIAEAAPSRAEGALPALATVFGQDTPALRDRAVRLAVALAPHAGEPAREAVRQEAGLLPDGPRGRIAAAFGEVAAAPAEPLAVAVLMARDLPGLPPPIASAAELAVWLEAEPAAPAQFERALAALVELSHRDRVAVARALRPWLESRWWRPLDADGHFYGLAENHGVLLARCALAVVSPDHSRAITTRLTGERHFAEPPLTLFVRRRFHEIIERLEAGATVPVLLAAPTAPTGHVDAETLVTRMELLDGAEPLEADFLQALLRLPRRSEPALAVRAGRLTSRAGAVLAAWLRDGGLPDPVVGWAVEPVRRRSPYSSLMEEVVEAHARLEPATTLPAPLTEPLSELWALERTTGYPGYAHDLEWWPSIMPSHREVLAAHLLEYLPTSGDTEVLAALVHGEGPLGAATAGVIAVGMGHERRRQRAAAGDALITLAARGQLPAADLGAAVASLLQAGLLKLNRVTAVLEEVVMAGAHAEVWSVLAAALPPILPRQGHRPAPGLGDLLAVAVRAATLSGASADLEGLAELAARKGGSRVVEQARSLAQVVASGGSGG